MFTQVPPQRGYLVKTMDGYGILLDRIYVNSITWLVFLGNGLRVEIPETDFQILAISDISPAPASFAELIQRYTGIS